MCYVNYLIPNPHMSKHYKTTVTDVNGRRLCLWATVEWYWQEKPKTWRKPRPSTLSTTNPTWTDPVANQGLCGEILDAWATAWSTTVIYGYVLIYLLCIRILPQIHAPHIEIRRPVTTLWEQTYWHCWERWLCHVGWSWVAEVMSRKLRTILCFLLFSPFQTRRFRV
jgi:hypothetical protein